MKQKTSLKCTRGPINYHRAHMHVDPGHWPSTKLVQAQLKRDLTYIRYIGQKVDGDMP